MKTEKTTENIFKYLTKLDGEIKDNNDWHLTGNETNIDNLKYNSLREN